MLRPGPETIFWTCKNSANIFTMRFQLVKFQRIIFRHPKGLRESDFKSDSENWVLRVLKTTGSHHGQQKSPKCSTWMQSQKRQNDLCSFPRQTIQYHSNPSLCPNQERWRSWSWTVLWRHTRPLELTLKRCPFHYRGLECKRRKSRNT